MDHAELETHIRTTFARQGMMQTFGAELVAIGHGTTEIRAPILPLAHQQQGFGHAALTFALGDTAAGCAAITLLGGQDVLTSEMKINLIAPSQGDHLVARGRVVKPGRRLVVTLSEVFAVTGGQEKLIALLTGTMVPVPRSF